MIPSRSCCGRVGRPLLDQHGKLENSNAWAREGAIGDISGRDSLKARGVYCWI